MLLVTIDPIGTVALFLPLTATASPPERRRIARKAVLVAGELLLTELGIRLASFQIAGGVILFLFGLQMVFGTGVAAERETPEPVILAALATEQIAIGVVALARH